MSTCRRVTQKCAALIVISLGALFGLTSTALAQTQTNIGELNRLQQVFADRIEAGKTPTYYRLLNNPNAAEKALNDDPSIQLQYMDEYGWPVYYITRNLVAAQTIRTNQVWPGGATGYNLSGAGTFANEFGQWDSGQPRLTHTEFGGRINWKETPGTISNHSTNVAGMMMAAGTLAIAQGMSYQANMDAYDAANDIPEMTAAASAGMHVSNHSYGPFSGWWQDIMGLWYWSGNAAVNAVEDWKFGFYTQPAADQDAMQFNAPYYLVVRGSGNERNDAGPGPGGAHFDWNGTAWVAATDTHNPDGTPGGWETVTGPDNAKNALSVGAVGDIPGGWTSPASVVMSAFSSWGPTDDGRIKPDIVTNGIGTVTPDGVGNNAYNNPSGTSFSGPSAAGSINLLRQQFEILYGKTPRSATMKALVINTADEAGPNNGPDYMFGWGLMNTQRAANIIAATDPSAGRGIAETLLNDGDTDVFYYKKDLTGPFTVTIAWTDPAATVGAPVVDDPTIKLVNDLDLKVDHLSTTYMPWTLNGANPALAATTGDNVLDNVEQVEGNDGPGLYRVTISHKGTITNSVQAYSLIWDGLEPTQRPSLDLGNLFEPLPGILPQIDLHLGGNTNRGFFFEVLEDMNLFDLGIQFLLPCPATLFASIYEAELLTVFPVSGGAKTVNTSSMKAIASGQITTFDPGWVYHYIPIDVQLDPCTDYYVEFTLPNVVSWPSYGTQSMSMPFDMGGGIRVRSAGANMSSSATALPVVAFRAEIPPGQADLASELEPTNMTWFTCTDGSTERGLYISPTQTVRLQALSLEALYPNGATLVAKVYESNGLTRGDLIATAQANATPSPQLFTHEVSINALLLEGKEYDVVMEFPPTTWGCASEGSLLPFTVANTITVLDGELGGNPNNTIMPHMSMRWREGGNGDTADLAKAGGPSQPPNSESSAVNNYGMFVEPVINRDVYSLGWRADVPRGKQIKMRVFEAANGVRGALVSEGSICSGEKGDRWHDVPIAATLYAGSEYDFEVEMEDVTAFGYWDDSNGLPYTVDGLTVLDGECNGDAGESKLVWMRSDQCAFISTAVPDDPPVIPPGFTLRTFPNPASGFTTISFSLDESGPVTVTVYDVRGRRVATLLDGQSQPAGPGSVSLDAKQMRQGVYFVKLETATKSVSRKISVVR